MRPVIPILTLLVCLALEILTGCGRSIEPAAVPVSTHDDVLPSVTPAQSVQATLVPSPTMARLSTATLELATPVIEAALEPTRSLSTRYVANPKRDLVQGVFYDDEDILAYDEHSGGWRIFFDGSDVGLRQTALSGFQLMDDGRLYFTVTKPVKISALGMIQAGEILQFTPMAYGLVTDGRLDRYAGDAEISLGTDMLGASIPFDGQSIRSCPSGPWRIMPLGDSITNGAGGTDVNGYRRRLYNLLVMDHYDVDFVGSMVNGTPDYDTGNEGHGGWQSADGETGGIKAHVYQWLAQNPADIILLHIGTNDISLEDYSADEVAGILDEIDRSSPEIQVLLALIVNRFPYSLATAEFNRSLRAMAEARSAAGDKIAIVDMEGALTYPDDLYDVLHPNDWGYFKMADEWFKALTRLIEVCKP